MELTTNYKKKPKIEVNGEITRIKEIDVKGGAKAIYYSLLTQDVDGNDVWMSFADNNFGFQVGNIVRVKGSLKTTLITNEDGTPKLNAHGTQMVSHKLYKVELVK